jgi:hypothetical protein
MGGRWEVGVVKRFPIPTSGQKAQQEIGNIARSCHGKKQLWNRGNEVSTGFRQPWILEDALHGRGDSIDLMLQELTEYERKLDEDLQGSYDQLNASVYKLYGMPEASQRMIIATLGERPTEVLWPQMQGKSADQKRLEHVWRLLSYAVKRVIESDEDGIVAFGHVAGEHSLLERVRAELESRFPGLDSVQVETEIVNELKKSVKGYLHSNSLAEWLDNVYFDYHISLYKSRPIFWHIASNQGTSPFAFGALVHYHKFDRNRMAKLRAQYLRETIDTYRREAALAEKNGRVDDRFEWRSRLEETQELDHRLQWVQEGCHEGPDGGDRDYRILTPWKTPDERPKGWAPDLDDGVKVNIEPLQKAGVLRIAKVV